MAISCGVPSVDLDWMARRSVVWTGVKEGLEAVKMAMNTGQKVRPQTKKLSRTIWRKTQSSPKLPGRFPEGRKGQVPNTGAIKQNTLKITPCPSRVKAVAEERCIGTQAVDVEDLLRTAPRPTVALAYLHLHCEWWHAGIFSSAHYHFL